MKPCRALWLDLVCNEDGQDLIEYALVVALMGLAAVATLRGLTANIATLVGNIGTTLAGAV